MTSRNTSANNLQLMQNARLVPISPLYRFLAEHCEKAAQEVRDIYVRVVGTRMSDMINRLILLMIKKTKILVSYNRVFHILVD